MPELLTEIFHGLGEESLKSVQTVALGVHPLQTILMIESESGPQKERHRK